MQPQQSDGVPAFTPPDPTARRRIPAWLILVLVLGVVVVVGGTITAVVLARRSSGDGPIGVGDHSGARTLDHFVGLRPVRASHPAPCKGDDLPGKDTSGKTLCYRLGSGMSLSAVRDLTLAPNSYGGGVLIQISLRSADTTRFADLTRRIATASPPGNQLAIVVRDEVVAAPVVAEPITGGELQIAGGFDADQATRLADRILH
ncbi:SecDF P1 head subdomain-containing protein [Actinocatenispora sera]|uniref:SecDF P1 head subdomain domain-containing protein n=1 Tax=Actinocatenispora sera TaxID=390989 RepID=A0A810L738_9ACTN|nr:hypothetical protein [Actinocatenispora sera]BCJ30121.1 hypothetical protein Asera_42290 [Actinocatenispora sera]